MSKKMNKFCKAKSKNLKTDRIQWRLFKTIWSTQAIANP